MSRTAKTHRLTALEVKKFADSGVKTPLHDGGGLYLRRRNSALLWSLRLTDPLTSAEQWHRLFPDDPQGGYPHKGLAEARAEARRLWSTRSNGMDPRVERRRLADAQREAHSQARLAAERRITLRALFERWASIDLQPRVLADGRRIGRKDGGTFTRGQFERRVFPRFGERAIEDVKRADLISLLDVVKAEGKLRTANVLLTDLKQMFRFALMRDLVPRNPLDTVSRRDVGGTPVERDRVLTVPEIRQIAKLLPGSGLPPRFIAGVWLILATGARVGELLGAAWADSAASADELRAAVERSGSKLGFVDLDRSTWYLPETKNQRDHTIHLSAFAAAQFRCLLGHREAGTALPWVFPSANGKGPIDVKSLGKQLSDRQRVPQRRLRGRTKATSALLLSGGRWTAHDLRRTSATLMASLGISGDVIDECLNHMIESRMRRTYIRDRRAVDQARAFDALGKLLELLLSGSDRATRTQQRHHSAKTSVELSGIGALSR
jgi:integrase